MGKLAGDFPAATLRPFYYKYLEIEKVKALQKSNGNYDVSIGLPNRTKNELQ